MLVLLTSFTIASCGQDQSKSQNKTKSKENYSITMSHPDINSINIVDKIATQVKHFDKEPRYFIRPLQNNCVYELLVNDFLVYKDYGIEKLATPIEINYAILRSGSQTVTVRLYPLGDALKRAYGEGETVTTLLPKTEMKISVVKYEAFNISQDLDDEIVVKEHTAPTKEDSNEFVGTGLPYYEYTFTFDATVPYAIKGWTEGQDLTKFDKEELEKKAVDYYSKVISIYKNKDLDKLARLRYGALYRISQVKYLKKEEIQELWDEMKADFDKKNKEFGDLENYVINFYGNKRIVSLKHPSRDPIDKRLRGRSAFWFKHIVGNRIRAKYTNLDLYLPKGQPLDSLQMIP